ncbi:hypothetical protein GF312_06630 [Candidatus Poribacteria bacterium]|nr:hypothetical protein [Candidatus Poribacteria bacterium]
MSFKVLIISLFLIPLNSLWLMAASLWGAGYPTTVSLFFNVIFYLFILVLINEFIKSISPRRAMSKGELLLIYTVLTVSSAINGLDMLQLIGAIIAGPHFLATPENEWQEIFFRYIPSWLSVSEKTVLDNYAKGESSFFLLNNLKPWVTPVLMWSGFTVSLIMVMLGLTLMFSSRWVSEEKLSYPIIQLPLHMVESSFFKNKMMWLGFLISILLASFNGLHFFFPNFPSLGKPINIGQYLTEKPLNAIGWLPIAAHPFAVGLGFFMPVELSFSCWFFYFFWKFERVFASMLGLRIPGFPFIDEQTTGSYVGLAFVALWMARKHISRVFRFKSSGDEKSRGVNHFAIVALIIGITGITVFCIRAGMSVKGILLFFVGYYLISITIGRIRAELGSPVHDLHFSGPGRMMVSLVGTSSFTRSDLTITSMFWYFNRAYRSHPMPCILEGMKLEERAGHSYIRVAGFIIFATIFSTLTGFISHLQLGYRHGAWGKMWPAYETFNRLSNWITTPMGGDLALVSAFSFGTVFVISLSIIRTQFIWFPLHPVGLVVSSSWAMNPFWFSIFLSWIIKYTILRYGGLKLYRKCIPLFLGLILGEFIADSGICIIGTLLKVQTYIWYG